MGSRYKLYKIILQFAILKIVVILFLIYFNIRLNIEFKSIIRSLNPFLDQTQTKSKNIESDIKIKELLKIREEEKVFNTDEFLEEFIRNISFQEIDLITSKERLKYANFDIDFESELTLIKPKIGLTGDEIELEDDNLFTEDEIKKMNDAVISSGMNTFLAKIIPKNRSLTSFSPNSTCFSIFSKNMTKIYDKSTLPSLSVIIVYVSQSDLLIMLLRTLHSLFTNTEQSVLKEVIIVEDFNIDAGLNNNNNNSEKGKLERYLITKFPLGKIRLIKLNALAGLNKARLIGAHHSIGDILFFLDSQAEVESRWWIPILQRFHNNSYNGIVQPSLHFISNFHLSFTREPELADTNFSWNAWFNWLTLKDSEKELKNKKLNPITKVTPLLVSGSNFAINRKFFWKIGSFDPGIVLGGENYEISLRILTCSGFLEKAPCSRVNLIKRLSPAYNVSEEIGPKKINAVLYNGGRVTQIYLDEFKKIFFENNPKLINATFGNLTSRLNLRKRLNCKNFRWFLDKYFPEKFKFELSEDSNIGATGKFKNIANEKCLIANSENGEVKLATCSKDKRDKKQTIYATNKGVFRILDGNGCLKAGGSKSKSIFIVKKCSNNEIKLLKGQENFIYNSTTLMLKGIKIDNCVSSFNETSVIMTECNGTDQKQKWIVLPI